ncbi:hypothetical protein PTI98_002135 [Pleurotus ostreatus]|nr:hypothetical protein PTI98_002135 [Pleurotus ostreatus]
MPSLGILDIEVERKSGSNSASPRWSRYFRGSPMEKNTAIDFGFPSCDDFQDPLWVDNVEDLFEHRLKEIDGGSPHQVS